MEPRKRIARKARTPRPGVPELPITLGMFSEGISLVRVARASLIGRKVAADEELVLQQALAILNGAYRDLHLAVRDPTL